MERRADFDLSDARVQAVEATHGARVPVTVSRLVTDLPTIVMARKALKSSQVAFRRRGDGGNGEVAA